MMGWTYSSDQEIRKMYRVLTEDLLERVTNWIEEDMGG
jgi:hypothetical protein